MTYHLKCYLILETVFVTIFAPKLANEAHIAHNAKVTLLLRKLDLLLRL